MGASGERVVKRKKSPDTLVEDLVEFVQRYVVMSRPQLLIVALWIIHTHCFQHVEQTPYLAVTSPEKQCGRSRLLEVLRDAGHVSAELQEVLLSPARFGNKKGRHGAGPVAHDVSTAEAEAVVSAAATAITFPSKPTS